ncbi:hypothetical protein C4577_02295 [Candidatus Parcubacteria bacterium]|nr:MAG: hypothetical protein C4577_02295 [Candidatus Parcubacteria bacterium]
MIPKPPFLHQPVIIESVEYNSPDGEKEQIQLSLFGWANKSYDSQSDVKDKIQKVVDEISDEDWDGISIWMLKESPHLTIVDMADWNNGKAEEMLKHGLVRALGDETNIVWHNEGGKPEGDTWIEITKTKTLNNAGLKSIPVSVKHSVDGPKTVLSPKPVYKKPEAPKPVHRVLPKQVSNTQIMPNAAKPVSGPQYASAPQPVKMPDYDPEEAIDERTLTREETNKRKQTAAQEQISQALTETPRKIGKSPFEPLEDVDSSKTGAYTPSYVPEDEESLFEGGRIVSPPGADTSELAPETVSEQEIEEQAFPEREDTYREISRRKLEQAVPQEQREQQERSPSRSATPEEVEQARQEALAGFDDEFEEVRSTHSKTNQEVYKTRRDLFKLNNPNLPPEQKEQILQTVETIWNKLDAQNNKLRQLLGRLKKAVLGQKSMTWRTKASSIFEVDMSPGTVPPEEEQVVDSPAPETAQLQQNIELLKNSESLSEDKKTAMDAVSSELENKRKTQGQLIQEVTAAKESLQTPSRNTQPIKQDADNQSVENVEEVPTATSLTPEEALGQVQSQQQEEIPKAQQAEQIEEVSGTMPDVANDPQAKARLQARLSAIKARKDKKTQVAIGDEQNPDEESQDLDAEHQEFDQKTQTAIQENDKQFGTGITDEWGNALEQAMEEEAKNNKNSDISQTPLTPEQTQAEQDWQKSLIPWVQKGGKVNPSPQAASIGYRFYSGLLNKNVGTPSHINELNDKLYQQARGIGSAILTGIAAFLEGVFDVELVQPVANITGAIFGSAALPLAQALHDYVEEINKEEEKEDLENPATFNKVALGIKRSNRGQPLNNAQVSKQAQILNNLLYSGTGKRLSDADEEEFMKLSDQEREEYLIAALKKFQHENGIKTTGNAQKDWYKVEKKMWKNRLGFVPAGVAPTTPGLGAVAPSFNKKIFHNYLAQQQHQNKLNQMTAAQRAAARPTPPPDPDKEVNRSRKNVVAAREDLENTLKEWTKQGKFHPKYTPEVLRRFGIALKKKQQAYEKRGIVPILTIDDTQAAIKEARSFAAHAPLILAEEQRLYKDAQKAVLSKYKSETDDDRQSAIQLFQRIYREEIANGSTPQEAQANADARVDAYMQKAKSNTGVERGRDTDVVEPAKAVEEAENLPQEEVERYTQLFPSEDTQLQPIGTRPLPFPSVAESQRIANRDKSEAQQTKIEKDLPSSFDDLVSKEMAKYTPEQQEDLKARFDKMYGIYSDPENGLGQGEAEKLALRTVFGKEAEDLYVNFLDHKAQAAYDRLVQNKVDPETAIATIQQMDPSLSDWRPGKLESDNKTDIAPKRQRKLPLSNQESETLRSAKVDAEKLVNSLQNISRKERLFEINHFNNNVEKYMQTGHNVDDAVEMATNDLNERISELKSKTKVPAGGVRPNALPKETVEPSIDQTEEEIPEESATSDERKTQVAPLRQRKLPETFEEKENIRSGKIAANRRLLKLDIPPIERRAAHQRYNDRVQAYREAGRNTVESVKMATADMEKDIEYELKPISAAREKEKLKGALKKAGGDQKKDALKENKPLKQKKTQKNDEILELPAEADERIRREEVEDGASRLLKSVGIDSYDPHQLESVIDNFNGKFHDVHRIVDGLLKDSFSSKFVQNFHKRFDEYLDHYLSSGIDLATALEESFIDTMDKTIGIVEGKKGEAKFNSVADKLITDIENTIKQFRKNPIGEVAPAAMMADEIEKKVDDKPENYEQTIQSPQFKSWFGDWENDPENASKVVDESGKPLVVYHGSKSPDKFEVFDKNKRGLGFFGKGYYFTDDLDLAERFTGDIFTGAKEDRTGKVVEGYLNIKNPFDMDAYMGSDFLKKVESELGIHYDDADEIQGYYIWRDIKEYIENRIENPDLNFRLVNEKTRQVFQKLGFDGIKHIAGDDYGTPIQETGDWDTTRKAICYVAFEEDQIKSVDNKGEFNPEDPNIYAMMANETPSNFQDTLNKFKNDNIQKWTERHQLYFDRNIKNIDTANLDENQKLEYKKVLKNVLGSLNNAAIDKLSKQSGGMVFYRSTPELLKTIAKLDPTAKSWLLQQKRVGGAMLSDGSIHIDGGLKTTDKIIQSYEVWSHEIWHKLGVGLDSDPIWIEVYGSEIAQSNEPLTAYALENAREGWAEFGRLINKAQKEGSLRKVEEEFPKCSDVVKMFGLWPEGTS